MSTKTLYDVLGVPMDATLEDLRKGYLRVARECHPDRTGNDPQATNRFKRATSALALLSDEKKRKAYDRTITIPQTVTQLLVTNQAGHRVVYSLLLTAPDEPRPGIHLAQVVGSNNPSAIWEREPETGETGKNGEENGDVFTLHLPK